MSFFRNILGYRDFSSLNSIKDYLVINKLIDETEKESINYLILFKTSKQTTWIISNNDSVFCFLDDSTKDDFEHRWTENKDKLRGSIKINPDYRTKTGIIDFGENHKRWLYSKELYNDTNDLENKINEILK